MHLTNRKNKGSKLKAGYKYQEILKNKRFGSTKLTVNATQCHDGPRILWLPKLQNAAYQNFVMDHIIFINQSPYLGGWGGGEDGRWTNNNNKKNTPKAKNLKTFFGGRYGTWVGTVVVLVVVCYNKLCI